LVVKRTTGKAFEDSELEDLGFALLEACKKPLNVLGDAKDESNLTDEEGQVTVVPKNAK
jgi:hypothetical protein